MKTCLIMAVIALATCTLALLYDPGLLHADERTDFLVNRDGTATQQDQPRIAVAGDGSFIITWVDWRGGNSDIYLQRFDSDGEPIGVNMPVNYDSTDDYQHQPSIATDLSGLASIVWTDYRISGYPIKPDLFFQRFDSSIAPDGDNILLTTEFPEAYQESPDISISTWGVGVVVWAGYVNGNWDIFGQLVAADGSLVGANFQVNDEDNRVPQHSPRVSTSPEGWFVVAWYDKRTGDEDIYVQRFDVNGLKLGFNTRVNDNIPDTRQTHPDVATDGAGHFTVVWIDWRNGEYPDNPDIYACKFDTSMSPVTINLKISTDSLRTAQREPAIAADRMGNVAIIWADSSFGSWNITGQMIDVDGVVREQNFRANSFGDSLQLNPDVALDGQYRYVTWADKRSGNFDIYASISRYNDPGLIVSPPALKYEMEQGGSLPPSQPLVVTHAGYNNLGFTVSSSVAWLTVTPSSGTTVDTVVVSINDNSLPNGTYLGSLTFVDTLNRDSTSVVSVRLDISVPVMSFSTDTLRFTGYAGRDTSFSHMFMIDNTGLGTLNYSLSDVAPWMVVSPLAGTAPDTVIVSVNPANLSAGSYLEPIEVTAPGAGNSPDTVWVHLDALDPRPMIQAVPDSIYLSAIYSTELDTFIFVGNGGIDSLNWHVESDSVWLLFDRATGSNGDSIGLTIADGVLGPGVHVTALTITDSSSINISQRIPVVIDLREAPRIEIMPDSIYINTDNLSLIDTFAIVTNSGMGTLNWHAVSSVNWLTSSPSAGSDNDSIGLRFSGGSVVVGQNTAYIDIIDSASINISRRLTLVVDYFGDPGDTILVSIADTLLIGSALVDTSGNGRVDLSSRLQNSSTSLFLPIRFDPYLISVDSFMLDSLLFGQLVSTVQIDSTRGFSSIKISGISIDSLIKTGNYRLGELFFTSGSNQGTTFLEPVRNDSVSPYARIPAGDSLPLAIVAGQLTVTGSGQGGPGRRPADYQLEQNYPNPFNTATVIDYYLPAPSVIELEVFNILGQKVATLASGHMPEGVLQIGWNGNYQSGRVAPSGIYFYRLKTPGGSLVRKMVLLK